MAVGLTIGEAEEVAHPHGDLGSDPGGQSLQGETLQRRDVGREGVGYHGEESRPRHEDIMALIYFVQQRNMTKYIGSCIVANPLNLKACV